VSESKLTFEEQYELFCRAQAGSQQALGELIESNRYKFAGIVQRFFPYTSHDMKEDLTNKCIAHLFRNWRGWKQLRQACFSTFAYRLAVNVLLQEMKHGHGRYMRGRVDLDEAREQSTAPGPEEIVIERMERQRKLKLLSAAIKKLKKRDQLLLRLSCAEPKHSYEQIAVVLGISMEAVKGRLHRLRHRVRHLLGLDEEYDRRMREHDQKRKQYRSKHPLSKKTSCEQLVILAEDRGGASSKSKETS
jgi:RNA polymerase sigma factor (sigma-70 family)